MNLEEIKLFIQHNISYKDGWEFFVGEKNGVAYLQIRFDAPCHTTGKMEKQHCRKWQLSEWMTKTELVRTAFLAVVQAERHETEELFKYRGQDIFNSHIAVDSLVKVCKDGNYEHRGDV